MIKPNGHKVIVKADDIEKTSKGGIIIGGRDDRVEKAGVQRGVLVAAGVQAWRAFSNDFTGPPWAEVGDYVLYSKYAGKSIIDPIDDAEYILLNDEDILARITEGSNVVPDSDIQKKVNTGEIGNG